ncbi:hypothetical protein [Epilithonimonas arachidiradicis]|uniref:hypothetical protein n=1 Tax=Epilithonimonas arachidiradicis TaxID=1617282 RepID=UPI0011C24108|nr:hypothetical protein [Epilithonimonas arachidiradicis]
MEWGKNFGKGISERLIKKFPELNISEIEYYKTLCDNVQNDCSNSIDFQGKEITVNELDNLLKEKVFKKYNWINKSNQRKLYSLYTYILWKEGLIK